METLNTCPSCNSPDNHLYLECPDWFKSKEIFRIMQCNSCGLLFTNPVPDEDEMSYYYDSEDYFSHKNWAGSITGNLYMFFRKLAIRKKYKLVNSYHQQGKILDFGCGTGELAGYFASNGWESYGYEPGSTASALLRERQTVQILAKEDLSSFSNFFNVITLWHVLEHVPGLHATLSFLSKALHNGGFLIIAVPNFRSTDADIYGKFWAAWDVPRHLYHFEKPVLTNLLLPYGFELHAEHVLRMDAYYISLISEKYKTGYYNFFRAALNGFRSNSAAGTQRNYSSMLLVFKKQGDS